MTIFYRDLDNHIVISEFGAHHLMSCDPPCSMTLIPKETGPEYVVSSWGDMFYAEGRLLGQSFILIESIRELFEPEVVVCQIYYEAHAEYIQSVFSPVHYVLNGQGGGYTSFFMAGR